MQSLAPATQTMSESMSTVAPNMQLMSESMSTVAPNMQLMNESMSTVAPNMQLMNESMSTVAPNLTTSNEQLTLINSTLTTMNEQMTLTQTGLTAINEQMTLTQTSLTALNEVIAMVSAGFTALQGSFDGLMSAISMCASALSAKASEISAIHISIPTVSTVSVAHNASGGIYKRGSFLTTFAEKSGEAAIPLDGSKRAKGLWQQTGELLGMFQGQQAQQGIGQVVQEVLSIEPMITPENNSTSGINISYQAPNININGNVQEPVVEQIRNTLNDSMNDFESRVLAVIRREIERKERVAYV